ncbi:hypothetical protein STCU_09797 [Strigomonas culicis]|nr:hypothetical protein STCU_09797 [Strigomonas culicis]|eukprot:EPY18736.1 hypothetical protein STCU_09797 [Strigomonas culicis]
MQDDEDALPPANFRSLSVNIANSRARGSLLGELDAARCFASERLRYENDVFFSDFVTSVDAVLEAARSSMDAEFVRMKEIYRLRDNLEEQVNRFARTIASMHLRKKAHEKKISDLHDELKRLEPHKEELVKQTRGVRDACLVELKKMFPERVVSIVGDINKFVE